MWWMKYNVSCDYQMNRSSMGDRVCIHFIWILKFYIRRFAQKSRHVNPNCSGNRSHYFASIVSLNSTANGFAISQSKWIELLYYIAFWFGLLTKYRAKRKREISKGEMKNRTHNSHRKQKTNWSETKEHTEHIFAWKQNSCIHTDKNKKKDRRKKHNSVLKRRAFYSHRPIVNVAVVFAIHILSLPILSGSHWNILSTAIDSHIIQTLCRFV